MEPLAREVILASFSPKQRKFVEFPNLENVDWAVLDYWGGSTAPAIWCNSISHPCNEAANQALFGQEATRLGWPVRETWCLICVHFDTYPLSR